MVMSVAYLGKTATYRHGQACKMFAHARERQTPVLASGARSAPEEVPFELLYTIILLTVHISVSASGFPNSVCSKFSHMLL